MGADARRNTGTGEIQRRLALWHCGSSGSLRVTVFPGVVALGGMAVVAMKSDPTAFLFGCELAAWDGESELRP